MMKEGENSDQNGQGNQMELKKLCPFVARHSDECYCTNMNSQKVPLVLCYCWRGFEQCEIYRRFLKEGSHS